MSRVKIFPNQNVQERFSVTKPRVTTNTIQFNVRLNTPPKSFPDFSKISFGTPTKYDVF